MSMVGTTLIIMLWHVNQIKIKIGFIFFFNKKSDDPIQNATYSHLKQNENAWVCSSVRLILFEFNLFYAFRDSAPNEYPVSELTTF